MDTKKTLQEKISKLPNNIGVYQFFDVNNKLLYIGKAVNLRSRVQSYFRVSADLSIAKQKMVQKIQDIKIIIVDSETEALLLETNLIKKHKPPFNILMKDDKNFQYIHITDDLYPKIEVVRQLYKKQNNRLVKLSGKLYGPYTNGGSVRKMMRLMKALFKYCDSSPIEKRGKVIFPKRPCLDFQMNKCIGPCAGEISNKEYQDIFKQIENFLEGDYLSVKKNVNRKMKEAALSKEFEKAAKLRDQLKSLDMLSAEQKVVLKSPITADYISLAREVNFAAVNIFIIQKGKLLDQKIIILKNIKDQSDEEILKSFKDQYYTQTTRRPKAFFLSTENRKGKNKKILEMGMLNSRQALQKQKASFEKSEKNITKALKDLSKKIGIKTDLNRVEIYDISNIQGAHAVGSMVVFIQGVPNFSSYRKFKIKTVQGADDFASLKEVLSRRLKYLNKNNKNRDSWPKPDLIIIDGGKGQLSGVKAILDAYNLKIPVISLAKKQEEVFIPGKEKPVLLSKHSESLFLIQRMRDEAHRFAIGFYRQQHLKNLLD